jgi:hypothetical protein
VFCCELIDRFTNRPLTDLKPGGEFDLTGNGFAGFPFARVERLHQQLATLSSRFDQNITDCRRDLEFSAEQLTGAPAALAFSDGANVLTNGTATATPPMPPATDVAINQLRRPLSTLFTLCWSFIPNPRGSQFRFCVNRKLYLRHIGQ